VPQLGHYGGLGDEIDSLKRDKNVLMLELVRLRQAQQVRGSCGPAPHDRRCAGAGRAARAGSRVRAGCGGLSRQAGRDWRG
jgi:hypothetical protein